MTITSQIEIDASPEEVRDVLLDFERWHEIKSDMMRSVERLPGAKGPVEKNEKLVVDFGGIKSQVNVLVNTPEEFRWRGDLLFLMSGEHTFRFEPSQTRPGKTLLINNEEPFRLNVILMRLVPAEKMFRQFCEDFKKRVESVVKGEA